MSDFDPSQITGLNIEAFERWLAYKKGKKQTYKDMSLHPLAMKFLKAGDETKQAEAVEHSISNNWSGFFVPDEKKEKYDPHAPKKRTAEQQKAHDAAFEASIKANEWGWRQLVKQDGPFGELLLAEALLCRYDLEPEGAMRDEKVQWLKEAVANRLRIADSAKVLNCLTTRRLVLRLFSDPGLKRLEERAKVAA